MQDSKGCKETEKKVLKIEVHEFSLSRTNLLVCLIEYNVASLQNKMCDVPFHTDLFHGNRPENNTSQFSSRLKRTEDN